MPPCRRIRCRTATPLHCHGAEWRQAPNHRRGAGFDAGSAGTHVLLLLSLSDCQGQAERTPCGLTWNGDAQALGVEGLEGRDGHVDVLAGDARDARQEERQEARQEAQLQTRAGGAGGLLGVRARWHLGVN